MSDAAEEYDNDEETYLQSVDYVRASREELVEAVKSSQLHIMKLLDENRRLRNENSNLQAMAPKKHRNANAHDDVLGYKGQVIGLAKRVLFTGAFILDRKAFQKDKPNPPENPRDQFTSDAAYKTSLTITLFNKIPVKFHPLLDPHKSSNFVNDFIHEHSEGRSTFFNNLRKAMPTILKGLAVDFDLLISADADRSKDPVLIRLLKFPHENAPTRFAPVLFSREDQNMSELFKGIVFLKVHRFMYFGLTSLAPGAKPAAHSNGMKLGFEDVNPSSMSMAATATRFVLSADTVWAVKGAKTGINWAADYRAYMEQLEFGRHQPHIKELFKTVHNFVFAGVGGTPVNVDNSAEDLTDLMRRFELGTDVAPAVNNDNPTDPNPAPAALAPVSAPPAAEVDRSSVGGNEPDSLEVEDNNYKAYYKEGSQALAGLIIHTLYRKNVEIAESFAFFIEPDATK
ncbi:hypothetical protein B0H19DRAFT_1260509 [Mycena capillaripes]|nr:hypothetical protein B0H19DRAFT_1260509 [Mycena capillaripes]